MCEVPILSTNLHVSIERKQEGEYKRRESRQVFGFDVIFWFSDWFRMYTR